jgi:uncharacterized protein (DUF4415 family)
MGRLRKGTAAARIADNMTKPVAKLEIDLKNPFQLAAAQPVKRAAANINPPTSVESSELSPPEETISKDTAFNSLYRPKKNSTTVRIDADVLLWLRAQGKGYQSRMNAILRAAMIASLHSSESK